MTSSGPRKYAFNGGHQYFDAVRQSYDVPTLEEATGATVDDVGGILDLGRRLASAQIEISDMSTWAGEVSVRLAEAQTSLTSLSSQPSASNGVTQVESQLGAVLGQTYAFFAQVEQMSVQDRQQHIYSLSPRLYEVADAFARVESKSEPTAAIRGRQGPINQAEDQLLEANGLLKRIASATEQVTPSVVRMVGDATPVLSRLRGDVAQAANDLTQQLDTARERAEAISASEVAVEGDELRSAYTEAAAVETSAKTVARLLTDLANGLDGFRHDVDPNQANRTFEVLQTQLTQLNGEAQQFRARSLDLAQAEGRVEVRARALTNAITAGQEAVQQTAEQVRLLDEQLITTAHVAQGLGGELDAVQAQYVAAAGLRAPAERFVRAQLEERIAARDPRLEGSLNVDAFQALPAFPRANVMDALVKEHVLGMCFGERTVDSVQRGDIRTSDAAILRQASEYLAVAQKAHTYAPSSVPEVQIPSLNNGGVNLV